MEFFGKEQWQQWHGTKTAPYTGPGSLLIPLESDPSPLEPVGFALWGTQQEMRSMHCTWKWRVSPKILLLAPPSQSRHSKGCTIDLPSTPQTLHSDLWGNSKNVNLKKKIEKKKKNHNNPSMRHIFATLCYPWMYLQNTRQPDWQYTETVKIGLLKVVALFLSFGKNFVATALKGI